MSDTNPSSFHDHDFKISSLHGEELNMSAYKGKYILCVNVASECGFTPQYAGLQELYETYQDKLVVIGFPCNQFGAQEPGSASEIAAFCQKNYGVTFPITEKIDVLGDQKHPIYDWLTDETKNGFETIEVNWNFNKFLISPEGAWLSWSASQNEPMKLPAIEDYLA